MLKVAHLHCTSSWQYAAHLRYIQCSALHIHYCLFYVVAFSLKGSRSSQSHQPCSSTLDIVSPGSQIFMHQYPSLCALMCYMWQAEETTSRSLQSFHKLALKILFNIITAERRNVTFQFLKCENVSAFYWIFTLRTCMQTHIHTRFWSVDTICPNSMLQ